MNKAALLIGGNQGDRHALINEATALIQERIGTVALVSGIYETEPWGNFEIENSKLKIEKFLNRALLVETPLPAFEVLREALAIEASLGRHRPTSDTSITSNSSTTSYTSHTSYTSPTSNTSPPRKYHSRPMDIDLIFYNEEIIDTEELTIPHPRAHLRRFVLEPLAEIIPDYRHPILGCTVKELLQQQQ